MSDSSFAVAPPNHPVQHTPPKQAHERQETPPVKKKEHTEEPPKHEKKKHHVDIKV